MNGTLIAILGSFPNDQRAEDSWRLAMLNTEEELAWVGVDGGESDEYTIRMLDIILRCQSVRAGLEVERISTHTFAIEDD